IADYVLYEYGTGAVMGVPAHDVRDFKFAKEQNLPIKVVIVPEDKIATKPIFKSSFSEKDVEIRAYQIWQKTGNSDSQTNYFQARRELEAEFEQTQNSTFILDAAYTEPGILINSGDFNGINSIDAKKAITEFAEKQGFGKERVQYRLRDWLISRQRYWGAPIPIIHCEDCGAVAVPTEDLPVKLPENVEFTGRGASPLAKLTDWITVP
ncbi:MAG: class I tRNA ligase family protein, partial [Sphaerospermopsis kisseleviana]